jgi:hypothetical protein
MRFTIVDAFSGEKHGPFEWIGEGSDFGDKSVNKAATIGHKFWLQKLLEVAAEDSEADPDSGNPMEEQGGRRRRDPVRSTPEEAPVAGQAERDAERAALLELAQLVGVDSSGERKPRAPKWFAGKVDAKLRVHGVQQKYNGPLERMPQAVWEQAVASTRADILQEHAEWCGPDCIHVVPQASPGGEDQASSSPPVNEAASTPGEPDTGQSEPDGGTAQDEQS